MSLFYVCSCVCLNESVLCVYVSPHFNFAVDRFTHNLNMDIMSLETTPATYFLRFLAIGSNNIVDARTTEVGVTLATLNLQT
jgi:hypothetical protein